MQFSAVTCNADGSLVICASGRDLLFIRGSGSSAVFGKVVGSIKDAHDSDIASVQVSPESDCLVTCGVDSTHARVWQMPRA
jgi:WD40 repeat protein